MIKAVCRLFGLFRISKGGESEIASPACAEALPRDTDYLDLLQQIVEKPPAAHAVGAFHPEIGRIFAACIPDARRLQCPHETSGIFFIDPQIAVDLSLAFRCKYRQSPFLQDVGDAVCSGLTIARPHFIEVHAAPGDHRATSIDSRNTAVGCISDSVVVGRIMMRVWPLEEMGFIN